MTFVVTFFQKEHEQEMKKMKNLEEKQTEIIESLETGCQIGSKITEYCQKMFFAVLCKICLKRGT